MGERRAAWLTAAAIAVVFAPIAAVAVFGLPPLGDNADRRTAAVLSVAGPMIAALASLIGTFVARH